MTSNIFPLGLSFLCFFLAYVACGILVPRPGTDPGPSAVRARSPNHWAAREFPRFKILSLWYLDTHLPQRWVKGRKSRDIMFKYQSVIHSSTKCTQMILSLKICFLQPRNILRL